MTPEERFAIQQSLSLIQIRVEDAFGYIRSDIRGAVQRDKRKSILDEISKLLEFVEVGPSDDTKGEGEK